jgi:hypothetical protein
MTEFRQYKSHPHAFHPQHIIYYTKTFNILHEDMTIARSLIVCFLQTRSVDVINRVIISHKALGIGELCNR